jgi:hypothetical protein
MIFSSLSSLDILDLSLDTKQFTVSEFGRLFNTYFQKNIQFYTLSDLDRLFSALNFIFRKSQSYVEGYWLPAPAEDWS